MEEYNRLISELEKSIKNSGNMISEVNAEVFRNLLAESTNVYIQAYCERDYESVEKLLREQRKLRKVLTRELRDYTDQAAVICSKMVQTYNIFNKLMRDNTERRNFAADISSIEKRFAHTREVLIYLYRHIHVQHKELKREFDIPGSTLSDLLKVLEQAECVEKIASGRCSFYDLTNEGRKYLKETVKDIDEEIIVDRDSFRDDSLKTVEGKMQFERYVTEYTYYSAGGYCGTLNSTENFMFEKWKKESYCGEYA